MVLAVLTFNSLCALTEQADTTYLCGTMTEPKGVLAHPTSRIQKRF